MTNPKTPPFRVADGIGVGRPVLSGGVQLEDLGRRGIERAVVAAEQCEGQGDLAVVGLPVVASLEIADRLERYLPRRSTYSLELTQR
jgi:hypothetical protein